ncbi:MAG: hypothetical protein ACD_37C00606G0001 [uncultured bacterium]|nr:MAG: hypothetical protein ACD_37C00606G0001 [uncultured bacterium]
MFDFKKIQDADIRDKKVLLRADLDVVIEDHKITDDSRLKASLETLKFLNDNAEEIVIIGHLGRPERKEEKYGLKVVANWYANNFQLAISNFQLNDFDAWKVGPNIILLENLRFDSREEENDQEFAKKLASLADIYINDAFASSHRVHASIVGITKFLPSFAGLHLQKEIEELSKIIEQPMRPLTIIVGGAKIETKLPLVEKMHQFADYVLVGGEIAENVGVLAKVAHENLVGKKSILFVADLTSDNKDITEVSIQNFTQVINSSKTVVWNGPLGEVEKCFDLGTREIAKAIANCSAYTIVGGGDTVAFLKKEDLLSKFSFVSTGGGAMLEFLTGEELPGIEVLKNG